MIEKFEKWFINYETDTGYYGDDFSEWWEVSDGHRRFRCDDKLDAEWLAELLNKQAYIDCITPKETKKTY